MHQPILGTLAICGAIGGASVVWARAAEAVTTDPAITSHARPEGLSDSDWSGILAARDASCYAVHAVDGGGHLAPNPGQAWRTIFDGRGFRTSPDGAFGGPDWSWGLELVSFGFDGEERAVSTPASVRATGQRVAYEWDTTLTEWFVNDSRGLEHGYTVLERPSGGGGPLRFKLAVRGGLRAVVQTDGRDIRFVNADGTTILNYAGLTVFDADGAKLPARFEPASSGLLLTVDEVGARYPLTVDPVAQQAYLKASNPAVSDSFGHATAVSGDTAVVTAIGEDSNATGVNGNQANNFASNSGAAYVFVRKGGVWTQQAYLKASNTGQGDSFGRSVAIDGDTIVVGAWNEDSSATGVNGDQASDAASNSGAAYVFVRNGEVWTQQAYLKASNTGAADQFGRSVAIDSETIVVGAWNEDSNATGVNGDQVSDGATDSGAAYVFVRESGIWTQQAYLKASNTGADDEFGRSAAIDGHTVVIGASDEDSNATGVNGDQANNGASSSGAAYVFVRDGGGWTQQAYLKASNTGASDQFGGSISLSGDSLVVGATGEDSNATGVNGNQASNSASGSGAAYVFVRASGDWSQQAYLKASNTSEGDLFGYAVAISGDRIVVGSLLEGSGATGVGGNQFDTSASQSGSAYFFSRASGVWSQQAYIKASNTQQLDNFGHSVGLSGATAVIGAVGEDSNSAGVDGNQANNSVEGAGAVFAFDLGAPPTGADLNDDGLVNGTDLAIVLGSWGPCKGCIADINDDEVVDGADIAMVLGTWTMCPPVPVAPTAIEVLILGCAHSSVSVVLHAIGGSGETLEWFTDGCGIVPIAIGTPFSTTVAEPTTFYARWTTICGASDCAESAVVYVEPVAPTSVTADPNSTICPGEPVTLTAVGGSGTVVYWYEEGAPDNCSPWPTCTSFANGGSVVVAPTKTTTYCAKWHGTCGLFNFSGCASITITVEPCD